MKISNLVSVIGNTWRRSPKQTIYIEGPPGGGKTQVCLQIPTSIEAYKDYTVSIIRFGDRDSSDLMGIPDISGKTVKWIPPEELYTVAKGKNIIVIDELSDCPVPMQNVLCGLLNDRKTANITLEDSVRIIATGNRVEDRSGAQRLVSKLGNRILRIKLTTDGADWRKWAIPNGISEGMCAFLQLKPDLLHDFNPDKFSNPSPRTWEMLDKVAGFSDYTRDVYLEVAGGLVGDVAAEEYTMFMDLLPHMPDIAGIIANPGAAPIPTDPTVVCAVITAFVKRVDTKNIDPMFDYMERKDFPQEFKELFISDIKTSDTLRATGIHEHARITAHELENSQQDMTT